MGFIRVIHHQHYDTRTKRFSSLAFKGSSDGSGISVFDKECAIQTNGCICGHINRHYTKICGSPPIFWDIPSSTIPRECKLDWKCSVTGDECHCNILGIEDKEARAMIKGAALCEFSVCSEDGCTKPFLEEDLKK